MKDLINVKVIGAGPSGAILSIALSQSGCNVTLVEATSALDVINSDRTYAITHSTRRLLQKIDIWNQLLPKFNPFKRLTVVDNVLKQRFNFTLEDLYRQNSRYSAIGWIISHRDLMNTLYEYIINDRHIDFQTSQVATFDNNNEHQSFDLIVCSDGSKSHFRSSLNIRSLDWNYRQVCIVSTILLRGIKPDQAYEIFTQDGPLALLPLGRDLYQILWTTSSINSKQILELSKSNFLEKLSTILPNHIEPDCIVNPPQSFPLHLSIATSLSKQYFILLGEAAHVLHPVAGQGLNLSIRDINSLSLILKNQSQDSFDINYIAKRYYLLRFLDISSIVFMTHTLVILFSSRFILNRFVRRLTLPILRNISIIRSLALSLMTDGLNSHPR